MLNESLNLLLYMCMNASVYLVSVYSLFNVIFVKYADIHILQCSVHLQSPKLVRHNWKIEI